MSDKDKIYPDNIKDLASSEGTTLSMDESSTNLSPHVVNDQATSSHHVDDSSSRIADSSSNSNEVSSQIPANPAPAEEPNLNPQIYSPLDPVELQNLLLSLYRIDPVFRDKVHIICDSLACCTQAHELHEQAAATLLNGFNKSLFARILTEESDKNPLAALTLKLLRQGNSVSQLQAQLLELIRLYSKRIFDKMMSTSGRLDSFAYYDTLLNDAAARLLTHFTKISGDQKVGSAFHEPSIPTGNQPLVPSSSSNRSSIEQDFLSILQFFKGNFHISSDRKLSYSGTLEAKSVSRHPATGKCSPKEEKKLELQLPFSGSPEKLVPTVSEDPVPNICAKKSNKGSSSLPEPDGKNVSD